ncbi:hypothetical protein EZS27_000720 [termite gut metagenome]|uniref:LamG-like jellyroll fold domain-containing protein n=1 Tax=termite gut metagenome TaxID=433724 RepID=A0A5J4T2N5_9ZZZZ
MKNYLKIQRTEINYFYLSVRKNLLTACLLLVSGVVALAQDIHDSDISFENHLTSGYITVKIPIYDDNYSDEYIHPTYDGSYIDINNERCMDFRSGDQTNTNWYWVNAWLKSGHCAQGNNTRNGRGFINIGSRTRLEVNTSGTKTIAEFRYYIPSKWLGKELSVHVRLEIWRNGSSNYTLNKYITFDTNTNYADPTLTPTLATSNSKHYTVTGQISSTTGSTNRYYGQGATASTEFSGSTFSFDVPIQEANRDIPASVKYVVSTACGNEQSTTKTSTITIPGYPIPKNMSITNSGTGKVRLNWEMATTGSISGNFIIQRADNLEFLNAQTIVSDLGINYRSYEEDISNFNLNGTYYYRIHRSSDPSGWGWTAGVSASTVISSNHKVIAPNSAHVTLDADQRHAKITWDYDDGIWSSNSKVYISRINMTTGGTKELIEVPNNSTGTVKEYTDELYLMCNNYKYEVQVKPGASAYIVAEPVTTAENVIPVENGNLSSLTVSKGYFSDRVELEWTTDGGPLNEFSIQRRERGTNNDFLQIDKVTASNATTFYQYVDNRLPAGILFDYKVTGIINCAGTLLSTDPLLDVGFRTPTGDIYGRVTFENGQAVENVELNVTTEVPIDSKSLEFTTGAVATVDSTYFLKNATDSISLQAWIAPSATTGLQKVISKDGMYELGIDNNRFYFKAETTTILTDTLLVSSVLSAGDFIHLTGVYDNSNLSVYVNGRLIKTAAFSSTITENDNPVTLGGGDYAGVIDEVRIWDKPLTADDVLRDYNRYLTGEETGLAAYYTFNYAIETEFYDLSYQSTKYNENHGKLGAGVTLSSNVPTRDQLGNKGITAADGSYAVRSIPYKGNGTSYQIIPRMGIHRFESEREVRFIGPGAQSHTVNFIDKSSFRVAGFVTYENSTIPVAGVNFAIDGKIALKSNGTPEETDALGAFAIQVPVGTHEVKATKANHTFVNDGRITDQYLQDRNYQDAVSGLELEDNTTIKYIGRVAGGTIQEEFLVGHSLSTNNLSDGIKVTLNYGSPAYSFDNRTITETHFQPSNQTKAYSNKVEYSENNVTIFVNDTTGEFVAHVIPEQFTINVNAGYHLDIPGSGSTVNFSHQFPLQDEVYQYTDSIQQPDESWKKVNYSDTVHFQMKQKFIKRYSPQVRMLQLDKTRKTVEYFGTDTTRVTNLIGAVSTIPLYNPTSKTYTFDQPVFVQYQDYQFKIEIFEQYNHYNVSGAILSTDEVATQDAKIKFNNDLADTDGRATELEADDKGVATYSFKAGDPEMTSGIRNINASITYGKADNATTIPWVHPASFPNGSAYLLGSRQLGTDFVTAGPDKIMTVLRDPPGSSSYSYLEKGITFSESSTYTGSIANEGSEMWTSEVEEAVITFTGVGAGVINTVAEAESGATIGIVHSEEYQGQETHSSSTTTTTRFQTGDSEDYVGPDADVYIGYSTNVTIGATENVTLISRENYDNAGGSYGSPYALSDDWAIIKNKGLSASQSFSTLFAYPQSHIENRLIPGLEELRNSILLLPSEYTESQLQAAASGTKMVYYLSLLNADHADFGKTNSDNSFDGPNYKIIYDSNLATVADTIRSINQSIERWEKQLADNEKKKTEAVLLQNYSFHGGSSVEYSESYSTGSTYEDSFSIMVGLAGNNDWAFGAGPAKLKFELEEQVTTTHGGTFTSEYEGSHSKGFVLADNGNDYLTVDVCNEKSNEVEFGGFEIDPTTGLPIIIEYYPSFIFKTRGGATSCPYEGEYLTKYYKPGEYKINESTLQIEVPGIDMPVKFIENVPSGETAKPLIWLRNNSEVHEDVWYTLKIDNQSNPNGATFFIDGAPIGNGLEFFIPAGETLIKTLEIGKGREMNYDDLQLVLHSQCQEEISDTVTFTIHFVPSCSDVNIKKPSNNWTFNTKLPTMNVNGVEELYLDVQINGFNVNYDNFNRIEFQYKSAAQSDDEWTTLMNYYNDSTFYKAAIENGLNAEMILSSYAGTIPYRLIMKEPNFPDQRYDLRAVSVCLINNEEVRNESEIRSGIKDTYLPRLFGNPQPTNGILTIDDDVRLNFNEPIAEGLLTRHNFSVQGVRNGSISDHSVSVDFDGTNDYLETEFEKSFEGKDVTVEFWVQTDQLQNATLFSHGNTNESLEVSLTADKHLKVNLGTSTITSVETIAFDPGSWAHVAVVCEADGHLTAYYNYQAVINRITTDAYNANGNLVLGKSIKTGGSPFRGKMHNVLVWEKALTTDEIQLNSLTQLSGLESGLMAYYPMNEGKGTTLQDKARGATFLINGAKWALPDGFAVTTDGSDYLKLATGSAAIQKDMDFTIEFWFKGAAGQKNATLFSNGRGDGQGERDSDYLFNVGFDENSKLSFTHNKVKTVVNGDYLDNNWHHFAIGASRAIGRAQIYMDGKLNTFIDASAIGGISSTNMFVGARGWYSSDDASSLKVDNYFKGQFDDLRFWELYRNERLVSENNNAKLSGKEIGLIHYYPFDTYIDWQGQRLLEFTNRDMRIASGPNPETDSLLIVGSTSDLVRTKDIAPLKDAGPVESLSFDFVTNNDALIINLTEAEYKVAKTIVTFTVTDVRDVNGNSIASPITWSAYIDRNQLKWSEDRLNLTKKAYEPLEFTVRAVNSGGSIQHYTIDNLPAWLDVTPSSGVVNPISYEEIHFTVNEGLNIGSYNEVIYLTNESNVSEALTLNLTVTGEKPNWTVNPANFQYNMSVFGKMRFNNIFSADKGDMLAAFDLNGKCIGVTTSTYDKALDMWYALFTVYNNEKKTNNLEFRMWDASSGKIYKAIPDVDIHFTNDTIYGTPKQPVIFDGKEIFYHNIALNSGWNWISFNLANSDLKDVNKTLSTGKWSANDIVKILEIFDSYSVAQKKWTGTLSQKGGFNNTSMFLINSDNVQIISVPGLAIDTKTVPITVKGNRQWNYISYLPSINTTVNEALAGYDAQEGDVVKSQNSFAMYSQNRWTGNLIYMEANKGYMLRRTANNDVTFIYPSTSGSLNNLRSGSSNNADNAIKYTNRNYAENMNVVATSDNLQEGDRILAYMEGDLRGVGEYFSGHDKALSFITITGNETHSNIRFELQRNGEIVGATNVDFSFVPNTVTGTIDLPVVLNFDQAANRAAVYPNPFQKEFKIIIPAEKGASIDVKVTDVAGRMILTQNKKATFSGENQFAIDGSAFANGIYIVKITTANGTSATIVEKIK